MVAGSFERRTRGRRGSDVRFTSVRRNARIVLRDTLLWDLHFGNGIWVRYILKNLKLRKCSRYAFAHPNCHVDNCNATTGHKPSFCDDVEVMSSADRRLMQDPCTAKRSFNLSLPMVGLNVYNEAHLKLGKNGYRYTCRRERPQARVSRCDTELPHYTVPQQALRIVPGGAQPFGRRASSPR